MAQVSGIQVRFSGDTSNLEKSVGRAQGAISNFAKGAAASLAAALSVGMFVSAGKAALQYADNIGKMAQKVGMTTEELSKLNYAAKLSDVSLSELQVGVQQLSKNMEAGSDGLEALGIRATDASGNLRSTNEVMLEVAEAFAGMEDGAGKTAIAMNIFGRSGAQLIPMLNSGRRGLKDMGEEAQRLNRVISDDAAKSAERFNDNMTRLSEAMDGLVKEIIDPVIPTLIELTEKLLELIKAGSPLREFITKAASWFDEWGPSLKNTRREIESIAEALRYMGILDPKPFEIDIPGGDLKEDTEKPGKPKRKPPRLPGGGGGDTDKGREPEGFYHGEDPFFVERLQMIRDNFATEREILAEEFAMNQEVLRGALDNQLLTEQEYHTLSEKLAKDHQDALSQIQSIGLQNNLAAAADFFGSMARIAELGGKKTTKIAKVFGIAQALISTFQGAAKALTLPFPANMAAYAAVLAQGMGAVASIRKVNDSGGSNSIGAGGGRAGSAAASDSGGGGSRGGGPTTTFSFTLMNDPMGFGEKFARQFIDQLNSTQRNGGQIRGVIA
jgi:phage host-nuclease inhibitor protein Gam